MDHSSFQKSLTAKPRFVYIAREPFWHLPRHMTISDINLTTSCRFTSNLAIVHKVKSSIQHWQLRDLLVFPSKSTSSFYTVYHGHVYEYDLKKNKKSAVLSDLDFAPTCIAGHEDMLAIGGQRSQLLVKHLASNWSALKTLGGAINNCIAMSVGRDGPKVMVGNNDETIKVVSIPDLGVATTLPIGAAVNYISINPDNTMMACVGDCNNVSIFDISQPDAYKVVSLLKMEDSGFTLSWNRSGTQLAAGSQDGTVHVWDIRSSKTLAKLAASQSPPKGAIRNVKFSQTGSVDLLAFAEHTSIVNLVDVRTFAEQDSIRVSPSLDIDVNISGMAFTPDSKSLLVGLENGAMEYKIDLRSRHIFPHGSLL